MKKKKKKILENFKVKQKQKLKSKFQKFILDKILIFI